MCVSIAAELLTIKRVGSHLISGNAETYPRERVDSCCGTQMNFDQRTERPAFQMNADMQRSDTIPKKPTEHCERTAKCNQFDHTQP